MLGERGPNAIGLMSLSEEGKTQRHVEGHGDGGKDQRVYL